MAILHAEVKSAQI